jgi:uncharacterized protein YkwD
MALRPRIQIAALAACALLALPAQASAATCAKAGALPGEASADELARASVCLLNKHRAKRGLRKLRLNGRLSAAARSHTQDMVSRRYFSHVSRGGTDVVDRLSRVGYMRGARAWSVGENLAWGAGERSTPRRIVRAWMNSAGHRANILNGRFREVGVGVVLSSPNGRGSEAATYTHTFGYRR